MFRSTPAALARHPVLYVPATRRQGARIAAKEAKLIAKAKDGSTSEANHVERMRRRAAQWNAVNRANSADPTVAPASSSALPIQPLLASARAPAALLPQIVPHSLAQSLAAAKAASETASETTATPNASLDSTAAQPTQSSVRNWKRTTIQGAQIERQAARDTTEGITEETVSSIEDAVKNLSVSSQAAGPAFAYGVNAKDAKTVLIDAPKHLLDIASKVGAYNSYDAVVADKSAPTGSSSKNPIIEPTEMAELLRRQISLENASAKEINKFNTKRVMEIFARKAFDTGSSEVQAAVFTIKINAMQNHIAQYKKDKSSKRQLQAILSKRAAVLKYLRRKDLPKFVETCRALGVEPDTIRA
ncbi:hypothetical protein BCR33DRAFT_717844 [Rhizoclosmatium globosum]|uniref:S15/NS1 RNA-binding domain-containing protein n=1 Tax=Rhizoclosmatium globosum TaxID=329046 RepID=A0A1Y2C7U9_9FUNG|nr:hypothetical protein BCR33DRAFT_717844 [Rhizoclosmatium globosum]|eukprot:ORY43110.1 hypothetical protein BCR33DRAFT_717844 [Rhizoclosmatium globosum]